jgi:small GTP-binding protein
MERKKYKCIIIGDFNVGKTSVLNAYMDKPVQGVVSTLGIDFFTKTVAVNGQDIYLTIWDTAGAERFHSLTHSYINGSDIVIVVYDLSKKNVNLPYWLRRAEEANPSVIGVLGCKNDLTVAFSGDLYDILHPWSRQSYNIVTGVCSSRRKKSVQTFFKRCLAALPGSKTKTNLPDFTKVSHFDKTRKNRTCCT